MLTYDKMMYIVKKVLQGLDVHTDDKDAQAFLKAFKDDIKLAEKNGWDIELPFDLEVLGPEKRALRVRRKGGPGSGYHGKGRPSPSKGTHKTGGSYPKTVTAKKKPILTLDKAITAQEAQYILERDYPDIEFNLLNLQNDIAVRVAKQFDKLCKTYPEAAKLVGFLGIPEIGRAHV